MKVKVFTCAKFGECVIQAKLPNVEHVCGECEEREPIQCLTNS
jgi:hypothetical protein